MVAPVIYGIGVLLARAAPVVLRALPSIGRGAFWVAKQPVTNTVRTAAVVGGAHYMTDGASTRALLATGEVIADGAGKVIGKDNVATAGQAALEGTGKIVQGLAGAGNTVVQRYGPEIVSEVTSNVPLGRLSLATTALRESAEQKLEDVTAGGITVPETLRPSGSFREQVEERIEEAEDLFGGLISKEEVLHLGNLAKQDAATNRFIQAGLLLGGLNGALKGDGIAGKGIQASTNALFLAIVFGAIGHFMFGQRSALFDAAAKTLSVKFGGAANNNTPQDSAPDAPAPAATVSRYVPTIAPQRPQLQLSRDNKPALMTPAPSMG